MTLASMGAGSPGPRDLRERDDWAQMVGGIVEVRLDASLVRVGRVGHATADSAMLWIEADAVEPRALFVKSEGYRVRPHYPAEPRLIIG
ncbi:hypothetical protein ABFP37_21560 [Burkholderia sp. RS01]|jgi:ribosome maturation factor RimP|uniref:hypothetical protein n=1 Tax=unclassified Burkholderia TaxID=2613784 RepID=UPI00321873B7